jgi:hypothetical protein
MVPRYEERKVGTPSPLTAARLGLPRCSIASFVMARRPGRLGGRLACSGGSVVVQDASVSRSSKETTLRSTSGLSIRLKKRLNVADGRSCRRGQQATERTSENDASSS